MYSKIALKQICIEITDQCNFFCIHCGGSSSPHKKEFLPIDILRKMLIDSLETPLSEVILLGGEPLLHPDILPLIKFINESNYQAGIISNGYLIDKAMAEKLKNAGLSFAGISIDSGLKEIHDLIRGKEGAFDNACNAAINLSTNNIETTIISSISKYNLENFNLLLPFIIKNDLTWQIQIVSPNGCRFDNEHMLVPEDFIKIAKFIQNTRKHYKYISTSHDIGYYCKETENTGETDSFMGCIAGIFSAGIKSNGDIVPCLSLPQGYSYGNIFNNSLKDVFYSKDFFPRNRTIDLKSIVGECVNCENFIDCLGGCPDMCLAGTNSLYDNIYCLKRTCKNK